MQGRVSSLFTPISPSPLQVPGTTHVDTKPDLLPVLVEEGVAFDHSVSSSVARSRDFLAFAPLTLDNVATARDRALAFGLP